MKMKVIYILLVSLVWVQVAGAQTVTKPSYDSAVDYLNCRAVAQSLKGNVHERDFNAACHCGETNYAGIKSFLDNAQDLDATGKLASEIDKLKGEYNKDLNKGKTVVLLSNTVFSDKDGHPKLFAFAEKRKGDEMKKFKTSLENDLLARLTVTAPASSPDTPHNEGVHNADSQKLPKPDQEHTSKNTVDGVSMPFIIYSLIFALILAGITLYLALKMARSARENDLRNMARELKEYVQFEIGKLNSGNEPPANNKKQPKDLPATRNEVQDLFSRLNTLESLVEKLRQKSETPVAPVPPAPGPQKAVTPVPETQPVVETKKEVFFLSTPNSNGSFNDSSATTTFREGASIYRFTKESFNKATFCIDEREASIKLALQYPDKSIDPVCEALNAYNPKASRIVTKSPGTAELHGENWVLKTKAKISYEG